MPLTRSPMQETDQWIAAAQLIEAYGDEVGDFLVAHIRTLMAAEDHVGAKTSFDISDKVGRIWCPCVTVH